MPITFLNIVFMGTPDFAAHCLNDILNSEHNVVGVVTAPDRQSGRGRKVNESAVKKLAVLKGLNIFQPEKLKSEEFHDVLKSLNADLFVVVAFRMLPEVVWAMPNKGTINLHASLLPQFRGAAPIQRAIMQGATESGATVFRLAHKIDTGNIICSTKVSIGPNENAGSLHDRILESGSHLLIDALNLISDGKDAEIPQDELIVGELLEAPKIFKEDRRINWSMNSSNVHNHIRGLSPYPAAFTTKSGNNSEPIKIIEGHPTIGNLKPGIVEVDNDRLIVGTADGCYEITKLQPAGKSAMAAKSFVNGSREVIEKFD